MATDYGTDISTFPDLDGNFTLISGPRVVGEAIARRLSTRRGALVAAPGYGVDLRDWMNESIRLGSIDQLNRTVENECLQDERVFDAQASITFSAATQLMRVSVTLSLADRQFTLVLAVSATSLDIITAG
jgi:hypothetical protein